MKCFCTRRHIPSQRVVYKVCVCVSLYSTRSSKIASVSIRLLVSQCQSLCTRIHFSFFCHITPRDRAKHPVFVLGRYQEPTVINNKVPGVFSVHPSRVRATHRTCKFQFRQSCRGRHIILSRVQITPRHTPVSCMFVGQVLPHTRVDATGSVILSAIMITC